jgi:hypothetical protein
MKQLLFYLGITELRQYVDFNGPKPYTKVSRYRWWKPSWMRRNSYRIYVSP